MISVLVMILLASRGLTEHYHSHPPTGMPQFSLAQTGRNGICHQMVALDYLYTTLPTTVCSLHYQRA